MMAAHRTRRQFALLQEVARTSGNCPGWIVRRIDQGPLVSRACLGDSRPSDKIG
jgi:hypothetical protein